MSREPVSHSGPNAQRAKLQEARRAVQPAAPMWIAMPLRIYNTLSREKEAFEPLEPARVNMYVCGPTVYDLPHMGHAKTYVSFDAVVRYLQFRGYDVLYVQNITDVGH